MRRIMCPSTAASFFFFQIESCVLQSAARHTCPWSNANAFLYIPCQWTRSWAGQGKGGGGLSWSRCAPTSVMLIRFSVIVNTSKGQLHSVHWASSDLGQTQFEQMVLKCFSWGPVHFFPTPVQSTVNMGQCRLHPECWLTFLPWLHSGQDVSCTMWTLASCK